MEPEPLFHSSKRRKTQHARSRDVDKSHEDFEHQPRPQDLDRSPRDEVDISDVLRFRKQQKAKGGMSFTSGRPGNTGHDDAAVARTQEHTDPLSSMASRFIGSTGQVVDVDEHMMAYIDSKLSAQRTNPPHSPNHTLTTTSTINPPGDPSGSSSEPEKDRHNPPLPPPIHSPKSNTMVSTSLNEIDLGTSTSRANLQRTTEALLRLQAGLPALPVSSEMRPPRKPRIRIGRDGKPYRPKPRVPRINPDDIAREKIVEQVLHEHGLNVYEHGGDARRVMGEVVAKRNEENDGAGASEGVGVGAADTDEQFAQQFRQEFMDVVAERQARQQVQKSGGGSSGKAGPGAAENKSGGPKLGGSRAARARMQLAQQQGPGKK